MLATQVFVFFHSLDSDVLLPLNAVSNADAHKLCYWKVTRFLRLVLNKMFRDTLNVLKYWSYSLWWHCNIATLIRFFTWWCSYQPNIVLEPALLYCGCSMRYGPELRQPQVKWKTMCQLDIEKKRGGSEQGLAFVMDLLPGMKTFCGLIKVFSK